MRFFRITSGRIVPVLFLLSILPVGLTLKTAAAQDECPDPAELADRQISRCKSADRLDQMRLALYQSVYGGSAGQNGLIDAAISNFITTADGLVTPMYKLQMRFIILDEDTS